MWTWTSKLRPGTWSSSPFRESADLGGVAALESRMAPVAGSVRIVEPTISDASQALKRRSRASTALCGQESLQHEKNGGSPRGFEERHRSSDESTKSLWFLNRSF